MRRLLVALCLIVYGLHGKGQTKISGYEYWFDNDYQNKDSIPVAPQKSFVLNSTINTNGLNVGFHNLYIRFWDDSLRYSITHSQLFIKSLPEIISYEYWFDDNYGAKNIRHLTPNKGQIIGDSVNVDSLNPGFHTFNIRFQSSDSIWSVVKTSQFVRLGASAQGKFITAYRYWFDKGDTTIVEIPFATPVKHATVTAPAKTYTLDTGSYTVYFQVKEASGLWSSVISKAFRKIGLPKISKITPNKGGNIGDVTVNIYGDGFYEGSRVILTKGSDTITVPDSLSDIVNGNRIIATLNLRGETLGFYNVVVQVPAADTVLVLQNEFEVINGIPTEIKVNLVGPEVVRSNAWQKYTVIVSNEGNVDGVGVPVWIAIPKNVDIKFNNEFYFPEDTAINWDTIPPYMEVDTLFNENIGYKIYPLIVSRVPGNSTKQITVDLRTALNQTNLKVWCYEPLYVNPLNKKAINCIYDVGTSVLGFLIVDDIKGCLYGKATLATNPLVYALLGKGDEVLGNFLYTYASTTLSCASAFFPQAKVLKAIVKAKDVAELGMALYDCADSYGVVEMAEKKIQSVLSFDPNDKLGPAGFGGVKYFNPQSPYYYQIRFENVDSATAPAQQVLIVDTLDSDVFEFSSFQFGTISIGDTVASLSPGLYEDSVFINLQTNKVNVICKINGFFDTATGIVTWLFSALDPETLLPITDPFKGFLPPNKTSPEGQGSVMFTIGLKKGLTMNREISNKAFIFFDFNPPIITPEWKNALDVSPPSSKVDSLPLIIRDSSFIVRWNGSDIGSGILTYSLYYSVNNGAYRQWLSNSSDTFTRFVGYFDSTYSFYTVARDSALNVEVPPMSEDAKTTVPRPTSVVQLSNTVFAKIYPNPANEILLIKVFADKPSNVSLTIRDIQGRTVQVTKATLDNNNDYQINTSLFQEGAYILSIESDDKSLAGNYRLLIRR